MARSIETYWMQKLDELNQKVFILKRTAFLNILRHFNH